MNLAVKLDEIYTYGDYLTWPDGERWEIIDGEPFMMSPAPLRIHQNVAGNIYRKIADYLDGKPCQVYFAPFDVRLPDKNERDEDILTVVQPDILVVCDKSKLDDRGCKGAPDFIIEIISASTAGRDAKDKLNLYEKHGVKEYWIVYPTEKMIMVFSLNENNQYGKPTTFSDNDIISTKLFPELQIEIVKIFEEQV